MNIRNIILAFLIFPLNLFSQSYSFNNGLWGHDKVVCCSNIYNPTETPSELYWKDSLMTICITNDSISVSKNFYLVEQISDCEYCSDFKVYWTTSNAYFLDIEGHNYSNEERVIFVVRIYLEGIQVGELNHPILTP